MTELLKVFRQSDGLYMESSGFQTLIFLILINLNLENKFRFKHLTRYFLYALLAVWAYFPFC